MTSCTTEDMTKKFKDTGGITFQIAHVKTEPLTFWFVFLMKASLNWESYWPFKHRRVFFGTPSTYTGKVFTHCLNIYWKPGKSVDWNLSKFINFSENGYIKWSHKFLSENNNANESIELLKFDNAIKM